MVLGFIVIFAAFTWDEKHVQVTCAVPLDLVVERVIDRNPVHNEVVGVDFRFRGIDGNFPNTSFSLDHVDGTGPWISHPVAGELDAGGVVGIQAESNFAFLYLRRNYAGSIAASGEICEFLSG